MFFRVIFGLLLIAILLATVPAHAANLTVTVRDVRNAEGLISVALYDSANSFLTPGSQIRSVDITAVPGVVPIVFQELPPGHYAVAAFHDENASGEFDTGFLGIPEEGYGFSNDARVILSPPSFGDAAVSVVSDSETKITINY